MIKHEPPFQEWSQLNRVLIKLLQPALEQRNHLYITAVATKPLSRVDLYLNRAHIVFLKLENTTLQLYSSRRAGYYVHDTRTLNSQELTQQVLEAVDFLSEHPHA